MVDSSPVVPLAIEKISNSGNLDPSYCKAEFACPKQLKFIYKRFVCHKDAKRLKLRFSSENIQYGAQPLYAPVELPARATRAQFEDSWQSADGKSSSVTHAGETEPVRDPTN